MGWKLEVAAPVNGRIHKAEISVLNDDGTVWFTDKADLTVIPERRRLAKRLAERLSADPLEVERKLETVWAKALNGHRQAQHTEAPAQPPAEDVRCTDLGNARRLVRHFGVNFRHCHPWKKDLVWDEQRWREDDTAQIERWAKETVRRIYLEAAETSNEALREALAAHALKSEDAKRIRAMIGLARSEPGIPILPSQLDTDSFLLNVVNGTIDLRTGQLAKHSRGDLITKLAPVAFDPVATCPLWLQCLDRWMDGNNDLISYLQRVIGYSLTGDVSEQCLWFLHGQGANGKSTFLPILLHILGDYATQAVSDLLLAKKNESHPTERADLFGRRFVATIETEEGKQLAEALMKQTTGGDRIRARKMCKDFFEFPPSHKIFLAANHKPTVRGTDLAVWRRIKMLPFTVTIEEDARDKHLIEKLKNELSGILTWAVLGCLSWQRNGLGEPDEVRQATEQYQSEQDSVQAFIDECCFSHVTVKSTASALLGAYQHWSGDNDMTAKAFGQRLEAKG
jgi:putative DNA primase/helicase